MPAATPADEGEQGHILLGLLESVDQDGERSQRRLAAALGIALGLVNLYLKRCIKKGLVKVREAPARRYVYYLTPKGFAEKSRLTAEYLSYSFGFFRQAKSQCLQLFERAHAHDFRRVVLAGHSDLAEIAALYAIETGTKIVAVVDATAEGRKLMGRPIVATFDEAPARFDAVVVTDLKDPLRTCTAAIERFGAERVLVPELLRTRMIVQRRARS